MKVAIHQSHYLPWLRYFHKIECSDVFVLLDDAQFNRNGYQNRNRIKGPDGPILLTVPVLQAYQQNLQEVQVNPSVAWQKKHWRSIEQHYRKAPYFSRYADGLRTFYEQPWNRLVELNLAMLKWFLEQLDIGTRLVLSHDLDIQEASTARLLAICHRVGADTYVSGSHAVEAYLDSHAFEAHGVGLVAQTWSSPPYVQLYPDVGHVNDLSILDLLLNQGPDSLAILRKGGELKELVFDV